MSHLVRRPPLARLWHHGPAVLGATLVTLLLLRAPQEGSVLGAALAVVLLQLILVLAWPIALVFSGYVGAALIGAAAAGGADVVILLLQGAAGGQSPFAAGGGQSPFASGGGLGALAAVLSLAVVLAFVHQLARRPPRRDLTDSLAGATLLAVSVVAASTYLALFRLTDGPALFDTCVAAIGVAVVTGHLVDLVLPYPGIVEGVPRGLLGFVLGTAAAMYVATQRAEADRLVEQLGAVILGGVVGGLACLLAIGVSYAATERAGVVPAQAAVQAVLPFALAAPVAYLVAILVGG